MMMMMMSLERGLNGAVHLLYSFIRNVRTVPATFLGTVRDPIIQWIEWVEHLLQAADAHLLQDFRVDHD